MVIYDSAFVQTDILKGLHQHIFSEQVQVLADAKYPSKNKYYYTLYKYYHLYLEM